MIPDKDLKQKAEEALHDIAFQKLQIPLSSCSLELQLSKEQTSRLL